MRGVSSSLYTGRICLPSSVAQPSPGKLAPSCAREVTGLTRPRMSSSHSARAGPGHGWLVRCSAVVIGTVGTYRHQACKGTPLATFQVHALSLSACAAFAL